MKIVELSLRRRVTVAMCAVAVVLFGLVAFTRLEVSLLPELTYPSLTVETRLPGAAPAEVEQLLTRPIEERIGVVSGVQRLVSVSRPGMSQVTVEFGWGRDMDFAAIDVREKLDLLRLPQEAEPPTVARFDPGADPILRLVLAGDDDLHALRELAEQVVEKDLEGTVGVAAIDVSGGYEDEIEIVVDQERLATMGLTIQQVAEGLAKANVDQAGGSLYEREARYLVRAHNRLKGLQEIRETVILNQQGRRVTVNDVAEVRRTHRERETITRLRGREAVQLAIYEEGDANTTTVAAAIHQRLDTVRERLPEGVELVVATDQSSFIRASVDEVLSSAVYGGVMAMVVLLLFLRDVRSTLIVATAIPISVIATFFLMYQTGTTLNVMSLGGLALGVGMLVDNAIVVLEAIHRRREAGANPEEASQLGAGEVGQAVVASTLTTVAVFLPVVFLDGIAAQLFSDMAVTVCFSLLASLAVSLTLIPSLAATLARPPSDAPRSKLARALSFPVAIVRLAVSGAMDVVRFVARPLTFVFDGVLAAITKRYPGLLRGAVRRPLTVLGIAGLVFAGTAATVPRLGLDLLPPLSQGEFELAFELEDGAALVATDRIAREAAGVVADDDRIERLTSTVGQGALGRGAQAQGEHAGALQVRMAPETTPQDEAEVIEQLRIALKRPEVKRVRLDRPTIFSLRRPLEVELYADDPASLKAASEGVRSAVARTEGVVGARASIDAGHPEVEVTFDRERMAVRGLDVASVAATVRHELQGEVATALREGVEDVDVRIRALERHDASPDDVRRLVVGRAGDAPIRLEDVAEIQVGRGPAEIHRRGQTRVAVVSADVQGRDMGAVARDVRTALAEVSVPEDVTVLMSGQQEEMDAAIEALLWATALAAFLVYLVMAAQFESLVHPFVVIFTLPLAFIGVVAALYFSGSSLSVVSMIGVVMLAGIVVNNAIVLVDAVNRRRRDGTRLREALAQAGQSRLRPILMTSATTVLGLLPMALAAGAGAELRQALAVAVIGGLVVATVLTLVVIPVVYSLVTRDRGA